MLKVPKKNGQVKQSDTNLEIISQILTDHSYASHQTFVIPLAESHELMGEASTVPFVSENSIENVEIGDVLYDDTDELVFSPKIESTQIHNNSLSYDVSMVNITDQKMQIGGVITVTDSNEMSPPNNKGTENALDADIEINMVCNGIY